MKKISRRDAERTAEKSEVRRLKVFYIDAT